MTRAFCWHKTKYYAPRCAKMDEILRQLATIDEALAQGPDASLHYRRWLLEREHFKLGAEIRSGHKLPDWVQRQLALPYTKGET
jgi:hypothetical protein